jgi:hypothetical protein
MEDFFNTDRSFRFIETENDYENLAEEDDIDPTFAGNQIALMDGLRDLFRKEIEAQSTYIEDLLHFCTGQAFIPDLVVYPNFRVIIEFSHVAEMKNVGALPVGHTCVNTLKFPASAYGGSITVFKEKLRKAIENSENGFNMA